MGQKVRLTIKGIHNGDSPEDEHKVDTECDGELFESPGSTYVMYQEKHPDFPMPIKGRIKFREGSIEIHRTGPVVSHMLFEERKKHLSMYQTPYGDISIGIDTKKVTCEKTDDLIKLNAEYVLEFDGEPHADSSIEICLYLTT
ncbi:MAG: DUF1934 domain-containing protein [Lachnospiraceae bacterium]|nr:DUF1934 domain-containing protein [Lachnospiraceae bacterium]